MAETWDDKYALLSATRPLYHNEDYWRFLVREVWRIDDRPRSVADFGCGFGWLGLFLLPMLARHIVMFEMVTHAGSNVIAATVVLYIPVIGAGLMWTVWHWRHDMAAWLAGMVSEKDLFRPIKLAMARDWWVAGIAFYVVAGLSGIYAAITEHEAAMRGLGAVESMLILLLLLETLVHRRTRQLPTEVPTVGEVLASCVRLAVRLVVIVVAARALLVDALGVMSLDEWEPHQSAIKLAAINGGK